MGNVRLRCCSPDKDECGFDCRFFKLPNECSKNYFCEWQCGLNLKRERQRFISRRIIEEEQS